MISLHPSSEITVVMVVGCNVVCRGGTCVITVFMFYVEGIICGGAVCMFVSMSSFGL